MLNVFNTDPATPTTPAQASAAENEGSHPEQVQGTYHPKVFPTFVFGRREIVNTVESESPLQHEPISFYLDDFMLFK